MIINELDQAERLSARDVKWALDMQHLSQEQRLHVLQWAASELLEPAAEIVGPQAPRKDPWRETPVKARGEPTG